MARVTILLPQYKTLELTRLCLGLLKRFTAADLAQVVVIDTGSADASLDYVRGVDWITLLERPAQPGEGPAESHARALDMALDRVETPYVLSIHTDTLVKRAHWLNYLLSYIEDHPRVAGVGSWKLEHKVWYKRWAKALEYRWQHAWVRLTGKQDHALSGLGDNYYYLRSHCALYRTDLLRQFQLHFADAGEVAGKAMHKSLVEQGYEMVFLPSHELSLYLEHVNHATMVFNPELSSSPERMAGRLTQVRQRLDYFQRQLEGS